VENGKKRVVIENAGPQIDCGRFPAKRAVGETVEVTANVFADGHDRLAVFLEYWRDGDQEPSVKAMRHLGNDRWTASFTVDAMRRYGFTVTGWVDRYASWLAFVNKKLAAGMDLSVELADGVRMLREAAGRAGDGRRDALLGLAEGLESPGGVREALEAAMDPDVCEIMARLPEPGTEVRYARDLYVQPQAAKAAFSTWYELFPRSAGRGKDHGTFADVKRLLPEIAGMGFDVLYLPPIHPIGETHRKGKNNTPEAEPGEPGSPWGIGSRAGGHTAVHPELGTLDDFDDLLATARDQYGLDLALDIAFQCSPDHPWVAEHPQWFRQRADGSIRHAENPPKVYQDIYPIDFESEDWENLWAALGDVFLFWADRGVRVFRVDNPHTKSLRFWEWCLARVREQYPETVFLSEAFTRPNVMYRLAKAGFTQSYTYFTWRNTKAELTAYMRELVETAPRDYFRPNFWPNTPDILPEYLQYGGRPAFLIRYILAATLSSNCGIYGPAFELCEHKAIAPGSEEYDASEKYEIRDWDRDKTGNLKALIGRINAIRRENTALQSTWNIKFHEAENDFILFYAKWDENHDEVLLMAVNLDPHHKQSAWVNLPLEEFGIAENQSYMVHDLIGDDTFIWQGPRNYIELDPHMLPGRIFRLKKRMKRETDFDYFF